MVISLVMSKAANEWCANAGVMHSKIAKGSLLLISLFISWVVYVSANRAATWAVDRPAAAMRKSNRMLYRLVCVGLTLGAFPALAQTQRCEDLNHLSLPGIAIRSATPVPAGMYAPPGVTARAVPGLCRVVGTVLPELGFEVWLPEKW